LNKDISNPAELENRPWQKLFQFGPIGLTLLLITWSVLISPYSKYGDNWAVYPVIAVLPIAIVWHILLIFFKRPRVKFVFYAIIHLWLLSVIWMICIMKISKDSL
jgi:hypothetical protein